MGRTGAALVLLSVAWLPTSTGAQRAPTGEVTLTASANAGGDPVRIRILRWSTEEERSPVIAALNRPAAAAAGVRGARGAGGPGARGRGARGGGDVQLGPTAALTAAIGKAPTLGYIWTNDVTGYSIKYAYGVSLPDGGERIILATDRRLGAYSQAWKPAETTPVTDYEFTVIELRLDSTGSGEGKTSLTKTVLVDDEARTIALEDYAAAPAILRNVKRVAGADPPVRPGPTEGSAPTPRK